MWIVLEHTKFHILVVILYSQEISGMPTPRLKICTKCHGKSVWKPVVLVLSKKFFGCWPLHNIFHLGQLLLKTQNLPSSISLLMSLSNFYVIKHLEIIHPPKTGGLQFSFNISPTKIPDMQIKVLFDLSCSKISVGKYMTEGRYMTNGHFLFGIWCLMSNEASSNFWSMMSCFTKWSTIYTSSSLYQHLTGTFFVYFSATKHTKFHIIVVILYSQEISYQYHYLLSGMPTPRFKICTKCDGKSV